LISPENVRYFTGYRPFESLRPVQLHSSAVLITPDRGPYVFVSRLTLGYARERCRAEEVLELPTGEARLAAAVVATVQSSGLSNGTLGVDMAHAGHSIVDNLRASFAALADVTPQIARMRSVKGPEEITALRRAAVITAHAMNAGRNAIRPGIKEIEVAAVVGSCMLHLGADAISHLSVKSGENGTLVQSFTSDRTINEGDVVNLDIGAIYHGYCADMTRSYVCGKPSDLHSLLYRTVIQAQHAAICAIRPGVPASEVDSRPRAVFDAAGYGELFPHLTGHGLGLSLHETPFLDRGSPVQLEAGMVVTVEPGVYMPDVGQFRNEDMVLVTGQGPEVLTRSGPMPGDCGDAEHIPSWGDLQDA
jgi:Xaa-Pro aminopeptidase